MVMRNVGHMIMCCSSVRLFCIVYEVFAESDSSQFASIFMPFYE